MTPPTTNGYKPPLGDYRTKAIKPNCTTDSTAGGDM